MRNNMSDLFNPQDYHYMALALRLASKGVLTTDPNPSVGCVIVKSGTIIAKGWHQYPGQNHAEVNAIKSATQAVTDATVYVTLEPCSHQGKTPPCAQALIDARVSEVIIASIDPNPLVAGSGIAMLQKAGIKVRHGLMDESAKKINPGFMSRMQRNRPWVRAKSASSLDGATAMSNGQSQWITGAASRRDVHQWRAKSSAIVTGIGTVLSDDPRFDVRDVDAEFSEPLVVILDRLLRTPLDAKILARKPLIFCSDGANKDKLKSLLAMGAQVMVIKTKQDQLDLDAVMAHLNEQQINTVWLECGATLMAAFFKAKLVDEFILYQAPKLLGENSRRILDNSGMVNLQQCQMLKIEEVVIIGDDIRIRSSVISVTPSSTFC